MSRKFVIFLVSIASFALVALIGWQMYSDLNVPVDLVESVFSEGEMEVSNVSFYRTVGEDDWTFTLGKAFRKGKGNFFEGLSALGVGKSGLKHINAASGDYDESTGVVEVMDVLGRWEGERNPFTWTSPLVLWSLKDKRLTMPRGFWLHGEDFSLRGYRVSVEDLRIVRIESGDVRWSLFR